MKQIFLAALLAANLIPALHAADQPRRRRSQQSKSATWRPTSRSPTRTATRFR